MSQKYAHYDINGNILGFYADDIHNTIPEPNIAITDEQWQDCLANQGLRKVDVTTKQIVTCEPPAPTKDQLLTQLDTQYQTQFNELKLAWAAAQLDGNTSLVAELLFEGAGT